jgi:hypothetical protein
VAKEPNFIAYGRRSNDGGWLVEHLSLQDAREQLGHDVHSTITTDRNAAFEDFGAGNYRIAANGPCAGRGATVPDWVNW